MPRLLRHSLLCLAFLPLLAQSQIKNEGLLNWDPSRKLSWADYKGTPDRSSDAAASTTTYLGIEYNISSNSVRYTIQSLFSLTRSWGLHKTDYILSHEQGHFDIAEIFARKLNKEMSEYKFNRATCQQDLDKIYKKILQEKERMQNDYDDETSHSIKTDKQAEWLKKISEKLSELKEYADYRADVRLSSNQ